MPDRDAFLRTIAAHPAEDGPRLVFADWLEEQGDSDRAEFIRLQIEVDRASFRYDQDHLKKEARSKWLLAAHWREWVDPVCVALGEPSPVASEAVHWKLSDSINVKPDPSEWGDPPTERPLQDATFRRGFPEQIVLYPSSGITQSMLGTLFAVNPIDQMFFQGNATDWERLEGRHLNALRSLILAFDRLPGLGGRADELTLQRVGESPYLEQLRKLHWVVTASNMAVRNFAHSPLLARLASLTMDVGTEGASALSDCPSYKRLPDFALHGYDISLSVFEELVASEAGSGLTSLDLIGNDDTDGRFTRALVESAIRRLSFLSFSNMKISDATARNLASATNLTQLTRLIWPYNSAASVDRLTESGVGAIANASSFPTLQHMDFHGQFLDGDDLSPLFNAKGLPALVRLSLMTNRLGDRGVAELLNGSLVQQLRTLDLSHNGIGHVGAMALARAGGLDGLQQLTLTGNQIGTRGQRALLDRFGSRVIF